MISNIYKLTDTGTLTICIGLTHEEVRKLIDDNHVLRLSPAKERQDNQPDVILFSAANEESLTSEMVNMFGTPGDDVEGPISKKENGE